MEVAVKKWRSVWGNARGSGLSLSGFGWLSFYDAGITAKSPKRSWGPRILVEKDVVADAAGDVLKHGFLKSRLSVWGWWADVSDKNVEGPNMWAGSYTHCTLTPPWGYHRTHPTYRWRLSIYRGLQPAVLQKYFPQVTDFSPGTAAAAVQNWPSSRPWPLPHVCSCPRWPPQPTSEECGLASHRMGCRILHF